MKIIVVGADGLVGKFLYNSLIDYGYSVHGTSRRFIHEESFSKFDLEVPLKIQEFQRYDFAIFCVGLSNISSCEANPNYSNFLNINCTIESLKILNKNGVKTVFLSTNHVFDGAEQFYEPLAETSPRNLSGIQKVAVEKYITDNLSNVCVLRLTKIFFNQLPILAHWNKFVSWIQLEDVSQAIMAITNNFEHDIFHLGGATEISYFEFAKQYFWDQPDLMTLIRGEYLQTMNPSGIEYNSLSTYLPNL